MNKMIKFVITLQALLIVVLILLLTGIIGGPSQEEIPDNISQNKETNKKTQTTPQINPPPEIIDFGVVEKDSPSKTSVTKNSKKKVDKESSDKGSPITTIILDKDKQTFTPKEIFEINSQKSLWGYFKDSEERLAKLKQLDDKLSLIDFRSEEFKNSHLRKSLEDFSKLKIYVLIELNTKISFKNLYSLKSQNLSFIPGLNEKHYIGNHAGIFYIAYRHLKKFYRDSNIRNVYILENYTTQTQYQMGIKSPESTDSLKFKIHYPYSKLGLKVFNQRNEFIGNGNFTLEDDPEHNQLFITTAIKKGVPYNFVSRMNMEISLQDNLNRAISKGKEISLDNYRQTMEEDHLDTYQLFTTMGEKIVSSEYIKNIVRQIDTSMDIYGIWRQITFFLDKDIRYDWQKRELFFSGNLVYYNIKDMYLNVKELSEKKVGACTERTSLEIAILRELGIAARSATRVYHIFTEIYLPNDGWVSTSLILNEIPLCHSLNEKMAYFIEWDQEFPIQLKWKAINYPVILENLVKNISLVNR